MPLSRPPLARMQAIHEDLAANLRPNCTSLASRLEVSAKTVQRDLEFMRDQLQLPIEYDAPKRGYCYTREVRSFPSISVTDGELLALFVARNSLDSYQGTPFGDLLRDAFGKLTSRMGDSIAFEWEMLSTRVEFNQVRPSKSLLAVFQKVSEAVLSNHRLRFYYKGLRDKQARQRTVQPYQVRFVEGGWYLLGWDEARRDWRVYSLPRLTRVQVLPQGFDRDPAFSSESFWRDSFGIYSSGKPLRVVLRFRDWAARLVAERKWHRSQRTRAVRNGETEVSLNVQATPELTRWILSWGDAVTVLQPSALRAEIEQRLIAAAKLYKGHP